MKKLAGFLPLVFIVFLFPLNALSHTNGSENWQERIVRNLGGEHGYNMMSSDTVMASAPTKENQAEAPYRIQIQTLPPLEGIEFYLNGDGFTTDENGTVIIVVPEVGEYALEVQAFDTGTRDIRFEFARWSDGIFTPRRTLEVSEDISLEAGFHVSYPVKFVFADQEGNPVSASRVTQVEIKNSLGDVITFPGDQVNWLQAGNLIGRDYGLELVDVVQTVQAVTIDGSNVVNRGQQRFVIDQKVNPSIEVLLYTAEFKTVDALFGFQVGQGIQLQFPDGQERVYSYGEEKTLQIESLARGTYRFKAAGVLGYAPLNVFVLSQPQEVSSIVFSVWDILLVLLLGLVVFPGLLIAGRPEIRSRLRKMIVRDKKGDE